MLRWLLVAIAFGLALFEFSAVGRRVDLQGRVELPPQEARRVADTLEQLYPKRPQQLHWAARRAMSRGQNAQALALLDQALERTEQIEGLLYDRVLVLRRLGAPSDEIDAAVARWRKRFASSTRADPRTVELQPQRTQRPTGSLSRY